MREFKNPVRFPGHAACCNSSLNAFQISGTGNHYTFDILDDVITGLNDHPVGHVSENIPDSGSGIGNGNGLGTAHSRDEFLLQEFPDIAWNLIIQLLPDQHQTTLGSYKPTWRKIIPDDREKNVTHQEYWDQIFFYAELAVAAAGQDTARLSALIDHFDQLPEPAFDQFLQALSSQPILELPEEQRLPIWDHLTKFTNKHRRLADAKWALPDELITRIERVSEQLAPTNPLNLYQHLFTDR